MTYFTAPTQFRPLAALSLLLGLGLLHVSPALAQREPVSEMDTASLVSALGGDRSPSVAVKQFRRTPPPDVSTRACPEVMDSNPNAGYGGGYKSAGATSKLAVVDLPYEPNTPNAVDMAIQFGKNSDAIQSSSYPLLDNLAYALSSPNLAQARFALAGHTDTSGDAYNNQMLSCARAIAVRNYLMQRGVPGERLGAYGFGPYRLLPGFANTSPIHRRVEIRRAD